MSWNSNNTKPPDQTWCWVTDGSEVWPALSDPLAAGGWTNQDCWDDFDSKVRYWQVIEKPSPPEGEL